MTEIDRARHDGVMDWRDIPGVLSAVRDQGNCGCCWAITAAGGVESLIYLQQKEMVNLSIQQLVDCDQCSKGCQGGWLCLALEIDYSFTEVQGVCDQLKIVHPIWKIDDFQDVSIEDLKTVLREQPVCCTLRINSELFGQYKGGIYRGTTEKDGDGFINHAVLLVGWKIYQGEEVYMFKHTGGPDWGEDGYGFLHPDAVCMFDMFYPTGLCYISDPMDIPVDVEMGDADEPEAAGVEMEDENEQEFVGMEE